LNIETHILRVISLRSEDSLDESFETILRNAGHKVTVLTSTEPAFALVSSSWPDVVLFDPISQFGMSGSIQRLRSSFEGTIVAAGHIPDPTIAAMLEELGVKKFAATASELLTILRNVPSRNDYLHNDPIGFVSDIPDFAPERAQTVAPEERQLELVNADSEPQQSETVEVTSQDNVAETQSVFEATKRANASLKLPSLPKFKISLPMKRWHRTALGAAVTAAVVIAVAVPFFGDRPASESDAASDSVAKALPVVPNLLTKPLAPLTLAEISGDILPLEIAGIKDRAVIEELAIAFWGDTAPDAFVTVNGAPVDVSEYGAFVVDYPLEDGANFIEILASDFQGRTSSQSFTIVSLQ
jgi:hypothetical protein